MSVAAEPARSMSVLVVDDHRTAEALRACGYDARSVNRAAALRLTPAERPDVVVADPGPAGCELARHLTLPAGGRRPLLVAVTDADRRTAETGYDLHLARPVDPAVLAGVMQRFARVFAPSPLGTPD